MSNPEEHSEIGASGAKRWLLCPGSVKASRGVKSETNKYAELGTAVHELNEECIRLNKEPSSFLGKVFNDITMDEDNISSSQVYVDFINAKRLELPNHSLLLEERVDLEYIDKRMFGTADAVFVQDFGDTVYVYDYKNGTGLVEADEDNAQLAYYGLAVARKFDCPNVVVGIIQPNAWHKDGSIREHLFSHHALNYWENKFKIGVQAVDEENPAYIPGDEQCMFCDGKATCPALSKEISKLAPGLTLPSPSELTPTQMEKVLAGANLVGKWVKSVQAYALSNALEGFVIRGYKLVKGKKGNREWVDEQKAIDALSCILEKDEVMETSIKSPTKIFKLSKIKAKKGELDHLFKQSEGKEILVPVDDKREEVVIKGVFDDGKF